ncbi:hypothetical protein KUC_3119 [Vreelandella boliviensis LC1]|uniref:Uncharacterized protein n=1 Tax=Vreelandella boliviensis LC1 TaxID=1072583 RepID=A0A7U9BYD6_9GAMM|nr:hypothetical protein KUC_3119 [Halomonas boliviensis LC1]
MLWRSVQLIDNNLPIAATGQFQMIALKALLWLFPWRKRQLEPK